MASSFSCEIWMRARTLAPRFGANLRMIDQLHASLRFHLGSLGNKVVYLPQTVTLARATRRPPPRPIPRVARPSRTSAVSFNHGLPLGRRSSKFGEHTGLFLNKWFVRRTQWARRTSRSVGSISRRSPSGYGLRCTRTWKGSSLNSSAGSVRSARSGRADRPRCRRRSTSPSLPAGRSPQ